MVETDVFKGMDEDEVRMHLMLDGWEPKKRIHVDGDSYEYQRSDKERLFALLSGSARMRIGYQWTTILAGDKVIIPPQTLHEAVIGAKGCTLFWASRIKEEPKAEPPDELVESIEQ